MLTKVSEHLITSTFRVKLVTILKDKQCTYKHNIETRSCNYRCSGKAISIIFSYFVCVALVIRACNAHAPYCHLWPAPLYVTHYLIKGMFFEGGKKCY